MIYNWYVTGDCHGNFNKFTKLAKVCNPEETGVIILGDVGLNYYLDERDAKAKEELSSYGFTIVCIRGNHEYSPKKSITPVDYGYNSYVGEFCYTELNYPLIHYLADGVIYCIGGKRMLTIGGAYSVDKDYRLANGWMWNPDEQLDEDTLNQLMEAYKDDYIDLILSHTCPYSWQPTDLFLPSIDQSKVDNTMEHWLDKFAKKVAWNGWAWGHFHADRKYPNEVPYLHQTRWMIQDDFVPLDDLCITWREINRFRFSVERILSDNDVNPYIFQKIGKSTIIMAIKEGRTPEEWAQAYLDKG